jgi:Ca2+-binding EF-hand superfamily protein
VLDYNGDGEIGIGDIARALLSSKHGGSKSIDSTTVEDFLCDDRKRQELELMLKEADVDADGRVMFNDFVNAMSTS